MANNQNKFNLRDMEVNAGQAKCIEETSMLDGNAKEMYATGENVTKEHITKTQPPGNLGAEGKY